ncbi:ComEC/Rec2 family competence protein [soil metagenome]
MTLEASVPIGRRVGKAFPALSWPAIAAEQSGRLLLWGPVLLIAGIWTYFALPIEPSLPVFAIATMILGAGLVLLWRGRGGLALKIVCLLLMGFVTAKARTELVASIVLTAPTGKVDLEGLILDVDKRGPKSTALTVDTVTLTGEGIRQIPSRIRLTLRGEQPSLRPGQTIRVSARLFPLPSPVAPGGYDFGRALWFEGIGATGRALGPLTIVSTSPSYLLKVQGYLHEFRTLVGLKLKAAMAADTASIAEALITGERASIPKEVNDSLQISGLAHILSISGLHMSLVAGGVFWLVRALLALSPSLAVAYPIKKWAALAGLAAGFAYLIIAVTSVATQRSYFMIAIMFLAVLADRPALSLRNLAIAALIVLIAFPEEALGASLQMSFLAVMGILAFHEAWTARQREEPAGKQGGVSRAFSYVGRVIFLAAATSLAAGGLSSIAAAYHFGRLAPYSILANLLAFPVMSLIVMLSALAAMLAMPLGVETVPLFAMQEGLRLVLAISDGVRSLPHAETSIAALPLGAALAFAAAAASLCLFRGWMRATAAPAILAGLVLAMAAPRPDILVERTGANAAIRQDDGRLAFANARRGRFAAEMWLRNNGEKKSLAAAAKDAWTCEGAVCRASVGGQRVAYIHEARGTPAIFDCPAADILIADFPLRGRCRSVPVRIDRFDVWRSGAHAIFVSPGGTRIETARAGQGERPWAIRIEPRIKPQRVFGAPH